MKRRLDPQALFSCHFSRRDCYGHTQRKADHGMDIHGQYKDVPGAPGLRRPYQPDRAVFFQGQGDRRNLRERRFHCGGLHHADVYPEVAAHQVATDRGE